FVQHAVEAVRLVAVAIDGVRDFLRCVGTEMVVLSGHGSETAHLPEQPLQNVDTAANVGEYELAGLLREKKQDRAGFEDGDGRAAVVWIFIDNRRDTIVWG